MLIGPAATKATIEAFRDKLKREPEGFIAQPTLALSTCPTCTASGLAPRHVDLRPFVLTGSQRTTIVPGGLTRVALKGVRLWSIRARAAAPRTPGYWTSRSPHAVAHRRKSLLAGPLC